MNAKMKWIYLLTLGSGHADLLENGECLLDCHFYDLNNQFVPVDYIDIWILK